MSQDKLQGSPPLQDTYHRCIMGGQIQISLDLRVQFIQDPQLQITLGPVPPLPALQCLPTTQSHLDR